MSDNIHNRTKENLTQRAYLNSATSTLDHIIKIIVGFFITTLILKGLGSIMFGVWQILGQFTGYTNPLKKMVIS